MKRSQDNQPVGEFAKTTPFSWGAPANGLQTGLRTSASKIRVEDTVDVYGAVRNLSKHPLSVESRFELLIRTDKELLRESQGPRSSTSLLIQPGEIREFVAWRLSLQINRAPGMYFCTLVYETAPGQSVRSGEVAIEVFNDTSRKGESRKGDRFIFERAPCNDLT